MSPSFVILIFSFSYSFSLFLVSFSCPISSSHFPPPIFHFALCSYYFSFSSLFLISSFRPIISSLLPSHSFPSLSPLTFTLFYFCPLSPLLPPSFSNVFPATLPHSIRSRWSRVGHYLRNNAPILIYVPRYIIIMAYICRRVCISMYPLVSTISPLSLREGRSCTRDKPGGVKVAVQAGESAHLYERLPGSCFTERVTYFTRPESGWIS